MNIQVKLSQSAIIRTIRKWDDPIMQADAYDAQHRGNVGQFGVINPCITDGAGVWAGSFSSNQLATSLSSEDLIRIAMLQTIEPESTLQAKMNWLMYDGGGEWGAPMQGTYSAAANWYKATNIKMIAACYAGQPVEIIDRRVIRCTYNGVTADVPMSRVRTFQPLEWSQPGALMLVSVVDDKNNYGEMASANIGRVRLPIYAGGRQIWLFDRWLI